MWRRHPSNFSPSLARSECKINVRAEKPHYLVAGSLALSFSLSLSHTHTHTPILFISLGKGAPSAGRCRLVWEAFFTFCRLWERRGAIFPPRCGHGSMNSPGAEEVQSGWRCCCLRTTIDRSIGVGSAELRSKQPKGRLEIAVAHYPSSLCNSLLDPLIPSFSPLVCSVFCNSKRQSLRTMGQVASPEVVTVNDMLQRERERHWTNI